MLLGYRSNDAVVTICQNNRAKSIEINDLNKEAEDMLGYRSRDMAGRPLQQLLPPRIAEMLNEYVEFERDANDVGQVLSKVQSFSIIGQDGKEAGYRLKVVRTESTGDAIHFKLVLQDKTGLRRNEALRKAIEDNFKGHEVLDEDTGLPDRHSLEKDVELMGYYSNKSDLRSCFAILHLDHYDELFSQYGRPACHAMMRHIAAICRQGLRPDDVVGSILYKRLGVLLIDTTPESARMVFNRLRWQIAANPILLPDKTSIGLSVSISFCRIGGRVSEKSVIEDCSAAIENMGAQGINALIEVE
ncbi:MAG: diguanylate cyclase [Pseudomonadota bacterium]|nr:diguanylate cyclase [Pseudomonadota bacterium]MDE3036884.1 diguanylate cyclase [Pseudomonadota bacterium]